MPDKVKYLPRKPPHIHRSTVTAAGEDEDIVLLCNVDRSQPRLEIPHLSHLETLESRMAWACEQRGVKPSIFVGLEEVEEHGLRNRRVRIVLVSSRHVS